MPVLHLHPKVKSKHELQPKMLKLIVLCSFTKIITILECTKKTGENRRWQSRHYPSASSRPAHGNRNLKAKQNCLAVIIEFNINTKSRSKQFNQ